jgi:hypothetical protein
MLQKDNKVEIFRKETKNSILISKRQKDTVISENVF